MSDLEIVYRDPKKLKAYDRNARTHSKEQVDQIAASIKEFGFTNPLLLREDRATIGAGHGRLLAARQLGLTKVPTIILPGLTDAQWKAYVIADNKLALNAGWDIDLLKVELSDLQAFDFDLSIVGFSIPELAEITADHDDIVDSVRDEWKDMPEFERSKPLGVLMLFENAEHFSAFEKLVGQTITAKSTWYPHTPYSKGKRQYADEP